MQTVCRPAFSTPRAVGNSARDSIGYYLCGFKGSRGHSFEFRVQGLGWRVEGLGLKVYCTTCMEQAEQTGLAVSVKSTVFEPGSRASLG